MLAVIVGALLIIIFINPTLKFFHKKEIALEYMLPVGLFFATCYVAYELKIPFLTIVIIYGLGLLTGAITQNIYYDLKEKDKLFKQKK